MGTDGRGGAALHRPLHPGIPQLVAREVRAAHEVLLVPAVFAERRDLVRGDPGGDLAGARARLQHEVLQVPVLHAVDLNVQLHPQPARQPHHQPGWAGQLQEEGRDLSREPAAARQHLARDVQFEQRGE